MRKFKNTIMIVLALLPIFTIMLFAVTNFHTTEFTDFVEFGEVVLTDNGGTISISYTENTICEKIIEPLFGEGELSSLYNSTAKLSLWLEENVGFPIAFTLLIFAYGFYMFVVEMVFMLVNLIAFIPRKCSEIFGG